MKNRNEWRSLISPVMIGAKLSPGPVPEDRINVHVKASTSLLSWWLHGKTVSVERNERGELRIYPDPHGMHRITRRGGQPNAPATLRISAGLLGVPLKLRDYEGANWRVAVDGAFDHRAPRLGTAEDKAHAGLRMVAANQPLIAVLELRQLLRRRCGAPSD
jgi:hypothetical protein